MAQDSQPAGSQPSASRPAQTPQELAREYLQLQRRIPDLFGRGDYQEAVRVCRRIVELAPNRPDGHYNLACALARTGRVEEAFAPLAEAVRRGLSSADHMAKDEDLAGLRQDPRFAELLGQVRDRDRQSLEGRPIPGLRTLTGVPAGGLPYRLRMDPNATRDRPNRLIVWLHPSGGSMNDVVEAMAPMLVRGGWALAVFTRKDFAGWTSEQAEQLGKTVQAIGATEGIDANRPVLMGFSAGGQLALWLWRERPGEFAGLVLDAAGPIDATASRQGRLVAMEPPKGPAVRGTPILVLVGEKDGASALWRKVQPAWAEAGVPLTVVYVADKGHAWLFDGPRRAALEEWLRQVAAGKVPSAPAPTSAPTSQPADD